MHLVDLLVISNGNRSHIAKRLKNNCQHDNQKFYCRYCLHGFTKKRLLNNHVPYCLTYALKEQRCLRRKTKDWTTPMSPSILQYFLWYMQILNDKQKQFRFVNRTLICKASTTKITRHVPAGFTYKIVWPEEKLAEDHVTYRRNNVAESVAEERLITNLRYP